MRARYGDIFILDTYPQRRLVSVSRPEHIRTVLNGSAEKFRAGEGLNLVAPVLGEHSVLTIDGDAHLRARKLLMPPFHGPALRAYQSMVDEVVAEHIHAWPTEMPVAAHELISALTMDIILRVVFGETDGARFDELRTKLHRLADIGIGDLLGWHLPLLQRFGPWRRHAQLMRRVDELIYSAIAQRRSADDLTARTDVLSRMMSTNVDGDSLSDAELRDQLITLVLAGYETTAAALAWTMHELAHRPDQLAAATTAATDGDTDYLEAVFKEAMRMRPVSYMVPRKLAEDLELGGYHIPAGYTIMLMIGLAHYDPDNHPQPDEFRPQRFLGPNPPPSTAWLPFGGGVRRCLGIGLAMMEATSVLCAVLTCYDITPAQTRPESPRRRHVTQVPGAGAKVILHRRN